MPSNELSGHRRDDSKAGCCALEQGYSKGPTLSDDV